MPHIKEHIIAQFKGGKMDKEQILKRINEQLEAKWKEAFKAFKEASACELGICDKLDALILFQDSTDDKKKWDEIENKINRLKQKAVNGWRLSTRPINQLLITKFVLEQIK